MNSILKIRIETRPFLTYLTVVASSVVVAYSFSHSIIIFAVLAVGIALMSFFSSAAIVYPIPTGTRLRQVEEIIFAIVATLTYWDVIILLIFAISKHPFLLVASLSITIILPLLVLLQIVLTKEHNL